MNNCFRLSFSFTNLHLSTFNYVAEQKLKAIQHLVALWKRKCVLLEDNFVANVHQVSTDVVHAGPVSKLEMLLRQKEMENHGFHAIEDESIVQEIKKFELVKRSALSEKTMDFWAKNKTTFKHVFELAKIVHAVPVTQVSVERAFSSLTFILHALRNRMHADTLEQILLIRLNKEILQNIPLF